MLDSRDRWERASIYIHIHIHMHSWYLLACREGQLSRECHLLVLFFVFCLGTRNDLLLTGARTVVPCVAFIAWPAVGLSVDDLQQASTDWRWLMLLQGANTW